MLALATRAGTNTGTLAFSKVDNKNKLKDLGLVSGLTLVSRVLGLVREIVVFACLGTSVYSSAFVIAFTVPNLFRRLLGEGAMTSALMPILSDALEDKEKPAQSPAPRIFSQVFTRLFAWLVGIAAMGSVAFWIFAKFAEGDARWTLGAHFASWLMPYMVFVCLAAIFIAALNLKGRFGLSSLNPIWLNLSIIGAALSATTFFDLTMHQTVTVLCIGILIGGAIQLGTVWYGLKLSGWTVRRDWGSSAELSGVWALLIPGLASGSILQINILLTRVFSNSIDDTSASVLYLASRLMELPLGVFAIAISTILFPELTRAQSSKQPGQFAKIYLDGMRWIAVITIPSVVGLWIYRAEIVESLFKFGAFDDHSVAITSPIVGIYALSIPAYAWIAFATRALHAQKRMQATLKVSAFTLVINAALCFVGMRIGGTAGLTLGNVLAAWIQLLCLLALLRLPEIAEKLKQSNTFKEFLKIAGSAAIMGTCCIAISELLTLTSFSGKGMSIATICLGIPVAVILYFSSLLIFRQIDTVNAFAHFRSKRELLQKK